MGLWSHGGGVARDVWREGDLTGGDVRAAMRAGAARRTAALWPAVVVDARRDCPFDRYNLPTLENTMDGMSIGAGPSAPNRIHTDFNAWLKQHAGRAYELHEKHVNPVFVKMLRTI